MSNELYVVQVVCSGSAQEPEIFSDKSAAECFYFAVIEKVYGVVVTDMAQASAVVDDEVDNDTLVYYWSGLGIQGGVQ
jgi:hypothetical protein